MNKKEYIAALRGLADFLEGRPFPDSWDGGWGLSLSYDAPCLEFFVSSKTLFGDIAATIGTFEKGATSSYIYAKGVLFDGAHIDVTASREQVCTRKVVGTRTVPAKPAYEEEIVEWECPESFVALGKAE